MRTLPVTPLPRRTRATELRSSWRTSRASREVLLSWFSLEGGRVREAWWTRSAFVARAMHEALVSERFCLQIELGMADGLSVDDVESASEERRALLEMV